MFEPTSTWPNFTFGQIGANNDQIWLPMGLTNDSEPYSNQLQFGLIPLFVNFPDMTSYVLDAWFWAMFEPTPTWPNFILVNFVWELGQIMARYDFLGPRRVILSNVRTDSNLT